VVRCKAHFDILNRSDITHECDSRTDGRTDGRINGRTDGSHQCPDYMSNTVSLISDDSVRRRLRSATSTDYHVPRTRTKFGDGAFSIAGSKAWNNLPQSVALLTV